MRRLRVTRTAAAIGPAIYLLAAHGAVVVSGFVFWLAAGRFTNTEDVGAAAAVVAWAMLTATLTQLGLPQAALAFERETPGAADVTASLLSLLWLFAGGGAVAANLLFWRISGAHEDVSVLPVAVALVLGSVGVAQATFVWFVASADHHPSVALVTSAIEAVLKVGFVIAFARQFGADGLIIAWALSVFLSSCLGVWVILPRLGGRRLHLRLPRFATVSNLLRLGFASHIGDLFLFTPTTGVLGWLIPAIVVSRYGTDLGGVYYISWSLAAAMNALPFAVSTTAIARRTNRGDTLPRWGSPGVIAACAAPVALAVVVGASFILSFFGPRYAELGSGVLRTLAVAAVIVAANAGLSARLKVRNATRRLHVMGLLVSVPVVLGAAVLPRDWGIIAVARVWLIAQALTFVVTAVAISRGPALAIEGASAGDPASALGG